MVHAGDRFVARLDALLAPAVGDDPALPQELRGFRAADHGVEHAAPRDRPEQRRDAPRLGGVELEVGVGGEMQQRREIIQAGDRVADRRQIGRRAGVELLPIGRHHAGGKMAAGGMAAHHDALVESLPEIKTRLLRLLDDLPDRHLRREVVAGHRDGDAMRVHAARHLAEARRLERAPVAAMDEQRERAVGPAARLEQVDGLARRWPVLQPDLGAAFLAGFVAVGSAIARPARENLRMLRHPRAVVVFNLVVDGGH